MSVATYWKAYSETIARLDAAAHQCGKGWQGTRPPGCTRSTGKSKAGPKTQSKAQPQAEQEPLNWLPKDPKRLTIEQAFKGLRARGYSDISHAGMGEDWRPRYTAKDPSGKKTTLTSEDVRKILYGGSGSKAKKDPSLEALGLSKKPSKQELKSAYHKAAMAAHPDKGGSAEKFRKVNAAYEALKKRYHYDSLEDPMPI